MAGALEDSRRIFIVMLHFYGTCEDTKIWAKIISALAKKCRGGAKRELCTDLSGHERITE